MKYYTLDDYYRDKKKKYKKEAEDFVSNDDDGKIYSYDDYQNDKKKALNQDYDISQWFKSASNVINAVNDGSAKGYNFAAKTPAYSKKIDNLLNEDRAASSYIESLKGTDSYDEIKSSYDEYKNNLKKLSDYTRSLGNFASQYNNEEDFNLALKNVERSQKYGALKTVDDYKRAMEETDDEDDKLWLSTRAQDIATSADVNDQLKRLQEIYANPNAQEDTAEVREALAVPEENREELINKYKALAGRKERQENLNKYYYDLSLDEKNAIKRYNDKREKESFKKSLSNKEPGYFNYSLTSNYPINTPSSEEKEKAVEVVDDEITSAAKAVAEKRGLSLDELAKWYKRGEEDDEAQLERQRTKEAAQEQPFWASYKSVIENPVRSIGTAAQYGGQYLNEITGTSDAYINPDATPVKAITDTREAVSEKINNPIGSFLYNTGMSFADFASLLPLNAVPGGQALSLSIMSTEAGTQAANEVLENGGSFDSALATGVASGIAEAVFEKLSLEQLSAFKNAGKASTKAMIKDILKGSFVEGSEEVFTDIANLITDNVINGDFSQVNENKKNYIRQGYTEDEADAAAKKDFANQLGESFAGGALSGGVMNAGIAGVKSVGNTLTGSDIKAQGNEQQLLDIADMYYSDNKDVTKYADKLKKQGEKGKEYSSSKLGMLRTELLDASSKARTSQRSTIRNQRIENSDLSESEKTIAKKFVNGDKLSKNDVNIINSNNALQRIVSAAPGADSFVHSDNFLKALQSTDIKLPKLNIVEYKNTDTSGMSNQQALEAQAEAQGFNSATTEKFINNYDDSMSVDNYTREFLQYHNLGRNLSPRNALDESSYSLNDRARIAAYESGKDVFVAHAQAENKLTQLQEEWKKEHRGYTEGTVDTSEIEGINLKTNQQASVDYISEFAKHGLNVKLYASKPDSSGSYTAPNGYYDSYTNTVHIDINAGKTRINEALKNGAMLSTMSHELTHVAEHAAAEYADLREAIANAVGAEKWEGVVSKEVEKIRRNHPEQYESLSNEELRETASREAIAEYCSDMLRDSKVMEKMIEENPSFAQKVINVIKNAIKRLHELYKRAFKDYNISKENINILKDTIDDYQALVDKWDKAVMEGIKHQNAQTNNNVKTEGKSTFKTIENISFNDRSSESKEILCITEENIDLIPNENIYKINKDFVFENEKKSKDILAYFKTIGEYAVNPKLGVVELKYSGSKSTVFHGFGREKMAAVYAIKDVIEKGVIINHTPNYQGKNYDRYIISGRGKIFNKNTCLSVVVKSYPQNSNLNNKFYLHEVLLLEEKKTEPHIMTGTQRANKPVSGSVSNNSLPQTAENNNQKTAQKSNDYFVQEQSRGNGYSGYSMSNNAVAAYEDGEKPLSKWSKSDIISAVADIDKGKANMLKKVKLPVLRKHLLYNSSWHHTSSMYNKTQFYAVDEDVIDSLTEDTIQKWEQEKATEIKPQSNTYKGDFNYITWEGSRKYPKAVKHSLTDVNIEERGQFYYVTDDNGDLIVKKKIGSNGTYARKKNIQNQDRDLVAVHNLTAEEFEKTLNLGGFPMPSIAVTKDDFLHKEYGDISVIFSRDTIDPKRTAANKVYGGDAWTPSYPQVEYKINSKKANEIYRKANDIGQVPFFNPVILHPNNVEDTVNRSGNQNLINKYKDDYGFKNAYLKDTTGKYVKIGKKETVSRLSDNEIEMYSFIADRMPQNMFEAIGMMSGREWNQKYRDEFESILDEYYKSIMPEITDEELNNVHENTPGLRIAQQAKSVYNFKKNGAETTKTIDDTEGAKNEIDRRVNTSDYEKWLSGLFDGIVEKSGIYNGKDPYTSSGYKKSFEQLHYEETLENVVKVMKEKANGEGALFSGLGIWGVAAKSYGTIEALKKDKGRLQTIDSEEYSRIKEQFGERFLEIATSIIDEGKESNRFIAIDNACENILDAVRNCKTKSGMLRELSSYYPKTTNATIDDILDLVADVGNMPTEYFEAKPQRAVGLDEIKALVIPDNISDELKTRIEKLNIPYYEYEAGNDESRAKAAEQAYNTGYTDVYGNEHNDIRFQDREKLTTEDDLITRAGDFDILYSDDEDLFEDENEENVDFEKMVEEYPSLAMEMVFNKLSEQSHEIVRLGRNTKLPDTVYKRIANKIVKDYSIERDHLEELSEKVKTFIESASDENFSDDFKKFVIDMRHSLLYSNTLDEVRDEMRKDVRDTIKGRTLIIPKSAESEIRSSYESIKNYARRLFGYGVTVALEENMGRWDKRKAGYCDINTFIVDIQICTGQLMNIEAEDGEEAYKFLEEYLRNALSPQYHNPYLEGIRENIDIAAVEVASDVITEYTHQLGLDAARNNKNNVRDLTRRLEKAQEQRDKLLKASKENAKLNNELKSYKERLETLQADTEKLDEVNWLIKSNYEDDTLLTQREELEKKVDEDSDALLRLKSTKPIKRVLERQVKRAVNAERAKQRKIISENRNRYTEEIKELKDKNKSKLSEWREARNLSDVVDSIGALQRKMAKALRNPTENVYVPDAFATVYIEACSAITDALNTGKVTMANIKLLSLKNELERLNNSDTEYNGEVSEQLFNDLGYIIDLTKVLGQQIENLEGRPITKKTISLKEATDIYNVLFEIYHTVQDATKQLGRQDKITNYESGMQIDTDMKAVKSFADKTKASKLKKEFLNAIRTARYYSGYNNNSEIMYHVNALNEGVRKANIYKMNAEKEFLKLTEENKKDYKRSLNEIVDIKYQLNNGEEAHIKMTRMMALQTLMTWTREQKSHNLVHMERSGIVVPDAELYVKGKIGQAYSNSTRIAGINTQFITALEGSLTDFEQRYRKIAENYFNHYAKKAINEVSNVIKHRSIAMADYYIPISVDKNYLLNELEELKYDSTLEGMGMLKSTVPRSNLPIIITSLNEVVARHINDTSKLYGLAIPARNFKKALNVSFTDINENGDKVKSGSVRDTIKEVWNEDANKFFNRLIADLESNRNNNNNASNFINKSISGLRKAMVIKTLTANISVVIKQAASYPTAGIYLSHSSLTKALAAAPALFKPGNYQKLLNEIDEHTAQHYMRRLGMSTPELHEFLNSWANKTFDKLPGKLSTVANPGKWIQGVDCFTTALLWKAAKNEVNKTGLTENSEGYWTKVTELYDKVIEDTQPMYDSLHRSELQKTTNEVWKSIFMFKTQPLQNTGIIYDSIGNALAHSDSKEARNTAIKAVSSQIISLGVFAGMSFLAAMALHKRNRYKDENDEITLMSILSTIINDMFGNGVGVAMPVFGNEIYEAAKAGITKNGRYDTFSMPLVDMLNDTVSSTWSAYDEIVRAVNMIQNGLPANADSVFSSFSDLGVQISGLFGIPTQNLMNIFNGAKSHFQDFANGTSYFESEGGRKPIEYAKSYGAAYTAGDSEKAKAQLDELYQSKYEEEIAKGNNTSEAYKKAHKSVRKALTNAYKLEYQKAFIKNDENRMQEISSLLSDSGYMVYSTNRYLSQVLSEWREKAQEDVIESFKK